MDYFEIKNIENFTETGQNGISLGAVLNDYAFNLLPERDRFAFISLLNWVQNRPKRDHFIPKDPVFFKKLFNLRSGLNFTLLENKGLIRKIINYHKNDKMNYICINTLNNNNKKKIHIQSETDEKEKKEKKEKNDRFEAEAWPEYPEKTGKKQAAAHYRASVKTEKDHVDLMAALSCYKAYVLAERNMGFNRRWQNGGTWFNNWRDWIGREPQKCEDSGSWGDRELKRAIREHQAERESGNGNQHGI